METNKKKEEFKKFGDVADGLVKQISPEDSVQVAKEETSGRSPSTGKPNQGVFLSPETATEIRDFVIECAEKLYKLKGIRTLPETIKAITDELPRLNKFVLKNKQVILQTIALQDMQFRTPKQLMLDDFVVTDAKKALLNSAGLVIYTEHEVWDFLQEFTDGEIKQLKGQILTLEGKLQQETFKTRRLPNVQWQNATNYLREQIAVLENVNESADASIKDLKTQLKEQERANKKLNNELNSLKTEYENLGNEHLKALAELEKVSKEAKSV